MTVNKKASPQAKDGKPSAAPSRIERLNAALKRLRRPNPTPVVIAVLALFVCAIAALFLPFVAVGKYAMLYMIADNAKKSGRADGNVYMRNGRIRGMVVPRLVRNAYTSAARSLFSLLSSGWNALSDSDRLSWINMSWYFKSDRFGNQKPVVGKQAYISLNTNITNVGGSPITTAPVESGGQESIAYISSPASQAGTTVVPGTIAPSSGFGIVVYATPPLSAGVSRPKKSAFRVITSASGAITAAAATAAYESKYGTSWKTDAGLINAKMFFQVYTTNLNTGSTNIGGVSQMTITA